MTATTQARGRLLRDLDGYAAAFVADHVRRGNADEGCAQAEVDRLVLLAHLIARGVAGWAALIGRLQLAPLRELEAEQARAQVLEAVFDDVLEPAALRVMIAALRLRRGGG